MQHILEYALDRAEYIVESARQRPVKRRCSSSGRKSLNQKLYELYIEECEREPELKKLRRNVNLLEKLVSQESVSCLVVNLYPGNEGYSLMLRGKNGSDSETIRLPYEEGELLEYLNGEQLPPVLLDLLEKAQVNIFHCGCVIAEVRDYRQSGNTKMPLYQSRYILLRPTMQTLICDVHTLTTDHHKWTQDDKLQLESQLILATAEPLCLDPSISVTCTANRLLYNKQKMNTRSMKRCFKRHSRAALNRQQEMAHYPPPPQLRLYDYLQKRKERKPAPSIDLKISKAGNCVDMWRRNSCQLTPPSEVDVEKYAVVEKSVKLEDAQPSVWPAEDMKDDYLFECEVGGQVQKTKVTIFQSVGDPQVYGEIYTAKDPKLEDRGSNLHLIHPPFLMGSKIDADRFLNQYKEVYERDVKCQVKMSHNPESTGGGRSQASPGGEPEADGYSLLVQPAMLGKTLKHRPPPIKLPSVSASSSSGTPYSSQTSSGQLKCTTPPPSKAQPLTRKHSLELGQVGLVSPAALSPLGSSQRSGTPKPSTPTPTNTPCSTPHPADVQAATPSVTPTPPDAAMAPQPALLAPFAQQQMALSQALPVMTIPLSSMATSITTGTSSSQVMANPTGLNFINVVGSVCGPQTLMSGSNPMLSCSPGALTPGINLGGILPPAGLMPTMQPTAQGGSPFGLGNPPGLRPLNLLQIPATPLIFNPLQQQVSQFSPQQQSSQSATPSPQQQGEPVDQGAAGPDQSLGSQAQAAVINLGGFMSPQAAGTRSRSPTQTDAGRHVKQPPHAYLDARLTSLHVTPCLSVSSVRFGHGPHNAVSGCGGGVTGEVTLPVTQPQCRLLQSRALGHPSVGSWFNQKRPHLWTPSLLIPQTLTTTLIHIDTNGRDTNGSAVLVSLLVP